MISSAIDKILGLAKIQTVEIDGRKYSKSGLVQVKPPEFSKPDTINTRTLTGIGDYIEKKIDGIDHGRLFLHVSDHGNVSLLGALQPENSNTRFAYVNAVLRDETFAFGKWHELEMFIIALQSQFVQTETVAKLIDHLGHLANETVTENKDDGFSQSYQIKTGITTKGKVKIENPMTFQPYRTFREIEQPESSCIFRLKDKGGMQCSLHEADGGQWKLEAIQRIKKWLTDRLPEITIIA